MCRLGSSSLFTKLLLAGSQPAHFFEWVVSSKLARPVPSLYQACTKFIGTTRSGLTRLYIWLASIQYGLFLFPLCDLLCAHLLARTNDVKVWGLTAQQHCCMPCVGGYKKCGFPNPRDKFNSRSFRKMPPEKNSFWNAKNNAQNLWGKPKPAR